MSMVDIDDLVSSPESKTLEFKRDLSSPRPLLKTLVAFANTAGGRLVIGIADDHSIVGVEKPLDEEERLCSLIADSIAPRLLPNIELTTVEDKTLLVIEVFVSSARPHWIKSEGPEAGVYVRLGSTTRQADPELVAELRRSAEGVSFDEMPMPDLSADALDLVAARQWFGESVKLDRQALRTLRLLTQHQGRWVPTKGAVLLFGKERELHFPDAWVQCGRFAGTDKARIFDHQDIREPLPTAVESTMLFLKKHAMRGADFSAVRRKDVWSIPLLLLREAVVNALVHADYSQRGAPIRIAFFDDRIEVESPGMLLPGMTVEDMRQGVSKIRNHVIARVFRELNLIEQWGSGVRRMFSEAEEQGLPEPEILEIGTHLRIVVRLAQPIRTEQAGEQVTDQVTEHVGDQVARLLECLKSGPLGVKDAMERLGLKHRPSFMANYLHPAVEAGLVEMTQPDSPQSPTQKYRLRGRT
jgi:ATP-dependent DNA helicase RecG